MFLSSIVFNDPEKLTYLNSLVHPATIKDANKWMHQQDTTGKFTYVIKEAALIFESDADKHLDYVIGVKAPLPLRLQRTMKRDNISKEAVELRMKNQMMEDEKMGLCDFVINNDEQELLIPQVLELHKQWGMPHCSD